MRARTREAERENSGGACVLGSAHRVHVCDCVLVCAGVSVHVCVVVGVCKGHGGTFTRAYSIFKVQQPA